IRSRLLQKIQNDCLVVVYLYTRPGNHPGYLPSIYQSSISPSCSPLRLTPVQSPKSPAENNEQNWPSFLLTRVQISGDQEYRLRIYIDNTEDIFAQAF